MEEEQREKKKGGGGVPCSLTGVFSGYGFRRSGYKNTREYKTKNFWH